MKKWLIYLCIGGLVLWPSIIAQAAPGDDRYLLSVLGAMWVVLMGLVALLWNNNGNAIKELKDSHEVLDEKHEQTQRDVVEIKVTTEHIVEQLKNTNVIIESERGTGVRGQERVLKALDADKKEMMEVLSEIRRELERRKPR